MSELDPRTARFYDRLAEGLLLLLALVVLLTFRDYGVAWDEPVQNVYGKMALNYYLTLGADDAALSYLNLNCYGALVDMLNAAANKFSPFHEYDTRHLIGGLIGIAGVAATWRLGRFYGGPRAGFVAALLLALTPAWHGSAFFNPKDIPFAVGLTWAALFMARIAAGLPEWRWCDFLGVGAGIGVALAARVGGMIGLAYLAAMLGLFAVLALVDRVPFPRVLRQVGGLVPPAAAASALALAIMYFGWPWSQTKPILGPIEAFKSFNHFPIVFDFPYFGMIVRSTRPPWYYEPGLFAVMLPELAVVGFAAAAALGLVALWRARRGPYAPLLPQAMLGLAIVFPMVYAPATGAVLFDGLRHMFFVVPPVIVAASLAVERLAQAGVWARFLALGLVAATTVNQGRLLAQSHPYEYVVYNAFIGGAKGAEERFELDYWGTAYRELVLGMDRKLTEAGAPGTPERPWRITVCGPEASAEIFFPPNYVLVRWLKTAESDFYISNTRYQCPPLNPEHRAKLGPKPVFLDVRRFGVPLARVYDLRKPPGQ
jgi:hypothetical protein